MQSFFIEGLKNSMAKVLFIIPKTQGRFGKPSTPHVGISYLASYIKHNGHTPKILDLRVTSAHEATIKKIIFSFNPDYIGITSVSLEYKRIYQFINDLTQYGIPIIYGGPHVSTIRENIFKE